MRVVKIGGQSGSQALLENGRMLVRTNIYFCIAHLFCLNVWPIGVALNIQACPRNPTTNVQSLGLDLVEPNQYPEHLISALRPWRRGLG